jgi:hypothetical protein
MSEHDNCLKANEEWRHDPVRRQAVIDRCAELAEIYAFQLSVFEKVKHFAEYASLYNKVKWKVKFYANISDTYIGNQAAFGRVDSERI